MRAGDTVYLSPTGPAHVVPDPADVPGGPEVDEAPEPLVPGTEEWARLITASKVAAILGLSTYDSPLSCWHKIRGDVPLEEETDDHRRGHYAEPSILAWWADQHPEFRISDYQPQFRDPDLPWAAATPDAAAGNTITDEVALVEAKTARDMNEWGEPGSAEIPAAYYVQTQFAMALARATRPEVWRTFVPVWGPHFEMVEYVVEFDTEVAAGILARCADFWESLRADTPPPLDDHPATLQTLKRLHPDITPGEAVELDADTAAEFIDATNQFKAAEARKRAAQSRVLAAMGAAQYATHGDVRVARRQPARGDAVALYQVAKSVDRITTGA